AIADSTSRRSETASSGATARATHSTAAPAAPSLAIEVTGIRIRTPPDIRTAGVTRTTDGIRAHVTRTAAGIRPATAGTATTTRRRPRRDTRTATRRASTMGVTAIGSHRRSRSGIATGTGATREATAHATVTRSITATRSGKATT